MKVIIYKMPDGKCAIGIPVEHTGTLRQLANRDKPEGCISFRIAEKADVITDPKRRFRAAWTDDLVTSTIDVDLPRARECIRTARNGRLMELDKEAALEARKPDGNLAAIDADAQRLRDLPTDPRFSSDILGDLEDLFDEV